jgi:hypothetical protein
VSDQLAIRLGQRRAEVAGSQSSEQDPVVRDLSQIGVDHHAP